MKNYNGHRSWNAWNVALWISNDEFIYRFAQSCLELDNINRAVNKFMRDWGGEHTPDGAVYNRLSVKLALEGLND